MVEYKYCAKCENRINRKEDICPFCGNPVSAKGQNDLEEIWGIKNSNKRKKIILLDETINNNKTKVCQFCKKDIEKNAIKCKYCGNNVFTIEKSYIIGFIIGVFIANWVFFPIMPIADDKNPPDFSLGVIGVCINAFSLIESAAEANKNADELVDSTDDLTENDETGCGSCCASCVLCMAMCGKCAACCEETIAYFIFGCAFLYLSIGGILGSLICTKIEK